MAEKKQRTEALPQATDAPLNREAILGRVLSFLNVAELAAVARTGKRINVRSFPLIIIQHAPFSQDVAKAVKVRKISFPRKPNVPLPAILRALGRADGSTTFIDLRGCKEATDAVLPALRAILPAQLTAEQKEEAKKEEERLHRLLPWDLRWLEQQRRFSTHFSIHVMLRRTKISEQALIALCQAELPRVVLDIEAGRCYRGCQKNRPVTLVRRCWEHERMICRGCTFICSEPYCGAACCDDCSGEWDFCKACDDENRQEMRRIEEAEKIPCSCRRCNPCCGDFDDSEF